MRARSWLTCGILIVVVAGCVDRVPPPEPVPSIEGNTVAFPQGSEMAARLGTVALTRTAAPAIRVNGKLTWDEDRTVRVYTPFAGRVTRILVQPGDSVKQGQVLAVIASPDFGQAQADARRAASDFSLTEKSLARVRELEQHGVAPRKDLQAAEADYERAQAELARTRERLKLYGYRGDGVDQAYALASPIAGVIVEKNINPGQELRPDQLVSNAPALFVVTDPGHLWAMLDATERDIGSLAAGQIITISTPVYRDQDFTAQVKAVSDFLDPNTRTLKVRAELANPHHRLKAEMFVTAELPGGPVAQLQAPSSALFFLDGKRYVFIDGGGSRFTRHEVMTGAESQGSVEIVNGLDGSEKLVSEGTLMLQQMLQPRRVQK